MAAISQAERERRDVLYLRGLKQCTRCGETLPLETFPPQSDGYRGLSGGCRPCKNAATADYQKRNPDKLAARVRRWNAANPDKAHASAKRYRGSCKGQAYQKLRAERAIERDVAAMVAKLDALEAGWAAEARAEATALAEQEAARAERQAYLRLYWPLMQRLNNGYYRALRQGFPLRADRIWPESLLAHWDAEGVDPTRCYYTGQVLGDGWHLDHMTPLSRGGEHVVENLVPCLPDVNLDKRNRTAVEYLEFLADDCQEVAA